MTGATGDATLDFDDLLAAWSAIRDAGLALYALGEDASPARAEAALAVARRATAALPPDRVSAGLRAAAARGLDLSAERTPADRLEVVAGHVGDWARDLGALLAADLLDLAALATTTALLELGFAAYLDACAAHAATADRKGGQARTGAANP